MLQALEQSTNEFQGTYVWPHEYAECLEAVVYRSRAIRALSQAELHELTAAAQSRNSREGITGVMLYDNEHFFQWLEGPQAGVARVMDSIRADRRHTDVEILDRQRPGARMFGEWTMKLATPGPVITAWRREIIDPPADILAALRDQPAAAASLLLKLAPLTDAPVKPVALEKPGHLPLGGNAAAVLKHVFLSSVIPQLSLVAPYSAAGQHPPANPRAAELADLLVATDERAAADLIAELSRAGARIGQHAATIFEPTARQLGDLWTEDLCTEFEVTLALCRLQTAMRLLGTHNSRAGGTGASRPIVLVAPEPGELHRLGAALDGAVLQSAGWAPHCEYPANDQALADLLASAWFDVLDLSLSPAFRRDHTLPQLTRTIAEARRASQNPDLVVVVAGRMFVEERGAGRVVGADHANTTSLDVNRSILRTVSITRTRTTDAQPVPSATVS